MDGIINEDPLSLDAVDVSAERYSPHNTIGIEIIWEFAGSDLRPLPSSEAAHGAFEARRSGPQHCPDLILWLRLHRLQPPGLDGSARDRSPWRAPSAAWHSS